VELVNSAEIGMSRGYAKLVKFNWAT